MTARAVRDAYAAVAGLYIELFGSSATVDAADLAFIERHLTIRPGRVLDRGCGPGHLTAHLRSLGVDAAGIDLVPEFIAHARTGRRHTTTARLDRGGPVTRRTARPAAPRRQ